MRPDGSAIAKLAKPASISEGKTSNPALINGFLISRSTSRLVKLTASSPCKFCTSSTDSAVGFLEIVVVLDSHAPLCLFVKTNKYIYIYICIYFTYKYKYVYHIYIYTYTHIYIYIETYLGISHLPMLASSSGLCNSFQRPLNSRTGRSYVPPIPKAPCTLMV